jgi:hypothetical protein
MGCIYSYVDMSDTCPKSIVLLLIWLKWLVADMELAVPLSILLNIIIQDFYKSECRTNPSNLPNL